MPTTQSLTWDCPECCGSSSTPSGDCASIGDVLLVSWSGGSLNTAGKVSDYHWRLEQFQYCLLTVDVYCDAGVVTATVTFGENSASDITVVSVNPLLITATLPASSPGCTIPCPLCNQPITITE